MTNGTNFCQFDEDGSPEQKWTFKNGKLYPAGSTSSCLDKYTVSGNSQNNNADIWVNNDDPNQKVFVGSYGNIQDVQVPIRLQGTNYYLTASSGNANGTNTAAGKKPDAAGNVFWKLNNNPDAYFNPYMAWEAVDISIHNPDPDPDPPAPDPDPDGSVIINGTQVPLAEWPVGSFWTVDGTGTGASLEYHDSWECCGFSRYVYAQIWGSDTYGILLSERILQGTANDFNGIAAGARLNCTLRSPKPGAWPHHSVVIMGIYSTGVLVYDCNWTSEPKNNYCIVGKRFWTFKQFSNWFSKIDAKSYTPSS